MYVTVKFCYAGTLSVFPYSTLFGKQIEGLELILQNI